MSKEVFAIIIIVIIISLIVSGRIFMIKNDWHFRIFKDTCIKEIDGTNYIGILKYSNRMRKTVIYYKNYNTFAYKKTIDYIEEFYDVNSNIPQYREYHENNKKSYVIYYDENGNITKVLD